MTGYNRVDPRQESEMRASWTGSGRNGVPAVALVFIAVLIVAAGHTPDDPKKAAKPASFIGAVKKIAEDQKSYSLRAKKGPYAVTWSQKTRFVEHTQITLGDLAAGDRITVLAEALPAQPGTAGGTFPPQLIKIQAIVAGDTFVPPPVPSKLQMQRIQWISDDLRKDGKEFFLGDSVIKTGLSREVLRVKEVKARSPEKKTTLFVAGYLDDSDRRHKKLEATEVIWIVPKYPDYDLTHDLKNRRPKKKSEKKDSGFGY
jgi:hypothetical protein